MKFEGTPFQKEVWNLILKIPYKKLVTYGDIAKQIAISHGIKRMSSQAIGRAVGKNPIPILVPCHRVVGQNYNLVGYAYKMDIKIKLLRIEGLNLKNFYFYKDKKKEVL